MAYAFNVFTGNFDYYVPAAAGAALTRVSDTNVTLTLGGTPATALLQATSITAGWTGTLSGTRGGTGVNNGASTITIGGSVTFSGAFATTLTVTATTTVTLPTSGTLYGTLAASITSAQLLASLTDPTGTGVAVFGTAPTFTTSILTPLIYGSSSASGNLQLQSTSSATRGFVQTVDPLQVATAAQAAGAGHGVLADLGTGGVSVTTGDLTGLRFVNTLTVKGSSTTTLMALFNAQHTVTDDGTARALGAALIFSSNATYTATVAGDTVVDLAGIPAYTSLYHSLTLNRSGAGTGTLTTAAAVYVSTLASIGTGWTVTNYYGLLFNPPSTITGTITNMAVIKSTLAAGANRFFLQDTGGAQSQFAGLFTKYNNVGTLGLGMPAIYGLDNRTGLTGADGAPLTLYTTVAANNIFRISADIFATAAVTGTATYTIKWTENATSQSMAVTATAINTLGTQSNLIRPDNATTITAQLTGVFTGTFTVVGLVEQIA